MMASEKNSRIYSDFPWQDQTENVLGIIG